MFDYLLGMEDESFGKIRLHTHFLTADSYLPYVLETGKQTFQRRWERITSGIPEKYIIEEPVGGSVTNCRAR